MPPRRPPLRSLRPVLLLLVLGFVAVPLVVYNFFVFDFQRVANFEQRFRGAFPGTTHPQQQLPSCLNVPSIAFCHPNVTSQVCHVGTPTKSNANRLVHFVNVAVDAVPLWDGEEDTGREQFTYLQFAALRSIKRALQPEMMIMHYFETPRGVWFTQCQRHLSLHQVLPPVSFEAMKKAGPPHLNRHERRQIIEFLVMLRTLQKQGGMVFSDFNTFLLRAPVVESGVVVMSQSSRKMGKQFGVGLHAMQAPPGHPFVAFLEEKVVSMVEENDAKLYQMPLARIVGEIVLDKYLEESAANGTMHVMDGVLVGTSNLFEYDGLHELLTNNLKAAQPGELRDVTGFHIDRYDFTKQTGAKDDFKEIARMQSELTLAGEWQSLDTLLGAVVRLAVTANTTAELDPLMT